MRMISAVQNPAKVFAATKMFLAHVCQVIDMLDRIIWITVNNQHRRHLQSGALCPVSMASRLCVASVVHPFVTLTPVGGRVGAKVTIPEVPCGDARTWDSSGRMSQSLRFHVFSCSRADEREHKDPHQCPG